MSDINDYKKLWNELWSVFRYDVIRNNPAYMDLFENKYQSVVGLLKRDPRPDLRTRNILICDIEAQRSSSGSTSSGIVTVDDSMYSLLSLIMRGPRGQVDKLSASVFANAPTVWYAIAKALCYNPNDVRNPRNSTIPLDINEVLIHLCDGESNGVPEAEGMNAKEAFDVLSETLSGFDTSVANRMFSYHEGALFTESVIPPVRFSDGQERPIPSTIYPFTPDNPMGWDISILLLLGLVVVKVEGENSIEYANVGSVSIGTLANLHKSEYADFF